MIANIKKMHKLIIALGCFLFVLCAYFMIKNQISKENILLDKLFFLMIYSNIIDTFVFTFLFSFGYFAHLEQKNKDNDNNKENKISEITMNYIVKNKQTYEKLWYGFWMVFAFYKIITSII